MKKAKKIGLFVGVGCALLIALGIGVYALIVAWYRQAPCVTVNGIVVTNEEIDLAYDQQKEGLTPVSREQVVEATVRNTVVRAYGRDIGIEVTAVELDNLLEQYQATGYYAEAVERYGAEGLRQGLYNHELFIRTREVILAEKVTVPAVTEADIQRFLEEEGLEGMTLTEKQREDILYTLTKVAREQAYDAFVDELVARATVVYS